MFSLAIFSSISNLIFLPSCLLLPVYDIGTSKILIPILETLVFTSGQKAKSFSDKFNLAIAAKNKNWLRGLDLNQGPSGYEPDELPDCSTPR